MKTSTPYSAWILRVNACFLALALVAGCTGTYGRLKRDPEVSRAFADKQVPSDYRYFFYGQDTAPYVVIGVESKFEAASKMWREIEVDTQQFKNMLDWVWADYGYSRYGAQILDPAGNRVGILYSSIYEITVKFAGGNRIVLMPHTPFLWGPTVEKGTSGNYLSSRATDRLRSAPQRASYP